MCWLERWDLFDSPDLRPPSSIYIRQLEEGFLLKRNSVIEEGIARGFQSNDKQKTKKELTRPPCAHSLTSALNYLHGSLPFLARRQTIFSEVPPFSFCPYSSPMHPYSLCVGVAIFSYLSFKGIFSIFLFQKARLSHPPFIAGEKGTRFPRGG